MMLCLQLGKVSVMGSKYLSYWLWCLWERIKSFTWSHKCAASFKGSQGCLSPVQNWRAAECLMLSGSHSILSILSIPFHSIPALHQLCWKEIGPQHACQRPPLSFPPTGRASHACPALTIPRLISFCSLPLLPWVTGGVQNARWSMLPCTLQAIWHSLLSDLILLLLFLQVLGNSCSVIRKSQSSLNISLTQRWRSPQDSASALALSSEGCFPARTLCSGACRWLLALVAPCRPFFLFPPSCKYQLRTLSHQNLPSSTSLVDITCWLSHYLKILS